MDAPASAFRADRDPVPRSDLPVSPDLPHRLAGSGRGRQIAAAAIAAGLVVAAGTWPWILSGWSFFPEKSWDHDRFHLPLVRQFAAAFPSIDLSDYGAATGPGMHLLLAAAATVVGDGERTLQWLASLFGIALAMTVAGRFAAARRCGWEGFAAALPLCLSPYLLGNSIWVMTDNLSLCLLSIVLLGAMLAGDGGGRPLRLGLAAAGAAFVRQSNLWVLPAILASGAADAWRCASRGDAGAWRPLLLAAIACMPALAIVVALAWLWGGLVPPRFADFHDTAWQRSTPLYALALLGVYGLPLMLPLLGGFGTALRGAGMRVLLLGWAVMLAVANDSYASLEEGRNGGWLWTLVDALPAPGGWSLALAALSLGGTLLLGTLADAATRAGRGPQAWLAILMLAGFAAAHAVNQQLFQRYFDPTILLFLGIFAVLSWPPREAAVDSARRTRWSVALLAMAAMQLTFASATLFAPLLRNGPLPADRVIEGVLTPPQSGDRRPPDRVPATPRPA